jgi:tetratricopeptide (TPR) repeat protein/TolB-like protein
VTSHGAGIGSLSAGFSGLVQAYQHLAPGTSIGTRYAIEAVLGEGGMGMVYRALDRELNRTVALKVIRPELAARPDILDRFKREILLASKVTHRNVVRIHDLGEAGDLRFISMSYIEGESLRALLDREGPLSPAVGVPIVRQVALALEAAHEAGIVHRDLKPHNVLIDREGQPYVGDFGISRSMDSEGGTMTETGAILGTVDYMSPEQARGDVPDHRSDIYALGIMMFEMFTGSLPFRASNPLSIMVKRVHEDAPQPSAVRPGMPPWLSAIILRAMQRQVKARYQSLGELVRDLDRQRATRAARLRLGKRAGIAAGVLLVAGLAAASGWRFLQSRPAGPVAVKTSLALLPFRNATGDARFDWVRTGATSAVRTGLVQAKALRLAGDDRVQEILAVLKPADGEEARPGTAQRIGKLAGVENVLAGSLLRIGDQFRIEATLLRVGDTAIAQTLPVVVDAREESAIPAMLDDLTTRLRKELGVSKRWGEGTTGAAVLSTRSVEALSLYGEAESLTRDGNRMEAAKRLEAAVAKDPHFAMAQALLADTYDALGYADKAKEAADRAAQMGRDASPYEAARIRAIRAQIAQDLEAAEKAYLEICDLTPNSADAFFDLAGVQEGLGELPEALESFRKVLRLDAGFADAHYAVGRVLVKLGNPNEAIGEFKAALDLHRASSNEEGAATVLNGLGNAYDALSQYEEAARYFGDSLEIRRRIGDRRGEAVSLVNLSNVFRSKGQYAEAVRLAQESIDTARAIDFMPGVARGYSRLGDAYQAAGRIEEALAAYQEGLKLMREVGDEAQLANSLSNVGYVNSVLGRYVDAFFFLKEALAKRRSLGDKREIVRSLIDIGLVDLMQGRYDEALRYNAEGMTLAREVGEKVLMATLSLNLAYIHDEQANYSAALALLAEGKALADELKEPTLQATFLIYLGRLKLRLGDLEGARQSLDEALRLGRGLDNASLLAEALAYRGDALRELGETQAAVSDSKEALAAARKTGDRWRITLARLYLAKASRSTTELGVVIKEAQAAGLAPFVGPARLETARLHLQAGRSGAASQEAASAIEAASPLGQRDILFQAHLLAARALVAQKRSDAAAPHAKAALENMEAMRQGLKDADLAHFLARAETVAFTREGAALFKDRGLADEQDRLTKVLAR